MNFVLDASVLMAIVGFEPGADNALELSRGGHLSWINAGEVLTKVVERGGRIVDATEMFVGLALVLHPFGENDAAEVAELRPLTRHMGLSFGDRACLALGRKLHAPVLTAERRWPDLSIGVDIRLIR